MIAKKKTWWGVFLTAVLMLVGMAAGIGVASADEGSMNSVVFIQKNDTLISQYAYQISQACRNDDIVQANFNVLTYSSTNGTVEFDNADYEKLDLSARRQAMKIMLDSIGSSGINKTYRMKLYNFVAEQDSGVSQVVRTLSSDASADVISAMGWLAPYYGVFATVWGLLCLLIFIFMAFGTTVDLLYMVVPLFRSFITDKKAGKPWLVSVEAYNAIKRDEDSNGGENYMVYYLKHRFIAFLVIGTIIVMIVTGTIWDPFLYFGDAFM